MKPSHWIAKVSLIDLRQSINISTAVRLDLGKTGVDACTLGTAGADGPDLISKTSYDADGKVIEVRRGVGGANQLYATYTYTQNGQKAAEADANGNVTGFEYDGFDRLSKLDYPSPSVTHNSQPYTVRVANNDPNTVIAPAPLLGTISANDNEQFTYDANGNKATWRRRNGQTHSYTYDALNREYIDDLSTGSTTDVYTAYDLLGRVCDKLFNTNTVASGGDDCDARYASSTGVGIQNSYDKLGRQLRAKDIKSGTTGRELQYGYDDASNRKTLTFPDGKVQGYLYNAGNMLTATGVGSAAAVTLGVTETYDPRSRLTYVARPNGAASSVSCDPIDRVQSIAHDLNGTGYDIGWTFAYNNASQLKTLGSNNTVYNYRVTNNNPDDRSYDGLNRNTSIVAVNNGTGYDANGNLVSEGSTGGQRNFSYDMDNRLLTATGERSVFQPP